MTIIDTTFVPADLDASRWEPLAPLYAELRDRPVRSAEDLQRWLVDRSELDAAVSEGRANLYIRMTRHTDDEDTARAWSRYLDEVPPNLKPVSFALDQRFTELASRFPLPDERYAVIRRATAEDVALFREENVPLETELAKLDQQYDTIRGAQTVDFQGETRTIPQMSRFLQEDDRATRESAWRAVSDRILQDRDQISDIYDRMIELRTTVARNAGEDNYRDYAFRAMHRFDYTPDDCAAFHDAVEQHVVPFLRRLDARRRESLGVDPLRPWDLAVDEQGRTPLRPFDDGQTLIERSRHVFDALDPDLAAFFRDLGDNQGDALDLDSRKGKAPGGYQYMRDRQRRPFIFMNAAGLHRDVETMIHEAGHAFHSMLCRDEPLLAYRHAPIEFAEVASMSMELLTMPEWDRYYDNPADADRARRQQLEGSLSLLPWIATIDAFQHWIYLNPKHTREQRTEHWRSLVARFGHDVSWQGIEPARDFLWQKQGHLFGVPFYYIEYGIAQLGSLGLWLHALEHGRDSALQRYKQAMSLGGSRPLPELFAAAGLDFDFSPPTVERLTHAVEQRLDQLPL